MKKIISLLLSLMAIFSTLSFSATANAQDYADSISQDGSITYFTNSEGRIFIETFKATGDVTIPSEIDGMPIYSYDYFKFEYPNKIKSVTIPKESQGVLSARICGQAPNINRIIIGEGIVQIPDWAFNDKNNVKHFYFPSTLKSVGDGSFFGCQDEVIYHYNGTYKQYYKIKTGDCAGIHGYFKTYFNDKTCFDPSLNYNWSKSGMQGMKKSIPFTIYDLNPKHTYIVEASTKKNFASSKKVIVKNKKQYKGAIKGLKSNKKYYFRVRIKYKKNGITYFFFDNIFDPLSYKIK